jgi:CheY-like chemotaxis protein
MDGLDATRLIRSMRGYGSAPIVALTADAFSEDRERCLAAGMSAHLGKPVTLAKLAIVLTQWLHDPTDPTQEVERQGSWVNNELSKALMLISGIEVPAIWCSSSEQLTNYCSLFKRFIHTASDEVLRLHNDLAAGNHDAARVLAHQIRGFSGFVGAQRVASLMGEVDRGLRTGASVSVITYLVNQCESELARLNDEFNALPMSLLESLPA